MPSANVELDGVILTTQPSDIKVRTPKGIWDVMEEGNWMGSHNTYGWEFILEWGPKYALNEVLTELRTRRAATADDDEHVLEFDDINGVHYTCNVGWIEDPDFSIVLSWSFDKITITLRDLG